MRYNVHSPCAFRSRIAKSIGVLVAAALIATLGLPGAAQAQEIDPTVTFTDGDGFNVKWVTTRFETGEVVNNWIVTLTRPRRHENRGRPAQRYPRHNFRRPRNGANPTCDRADVRSERRGDLVVSGGWLLFRLGEDATGGADDEATAALVALEACPDDDLQEGSSVGYTHGPFSAPMNFAANAVPGGVALTWSPVVSKKNDQGFVSYQTRMDEGEEEGEWDATTAKGALVVSDVDPGDYTFMLRVIGSSDNDLNTTGNVDGMAASADVTVPMPTPTLPEIAALLLAMLLLGSGAYLLRRRQSGGLTHA